MAGTLFTALPRATDANSAPYSGARWYFYASGTTTPQAIYSDADLTTPLANPIAGDSGGAFVPIYLDATLDYRAVLKSTLGGTTLIDIDPYVMGGNGTNGAFSVGYGSTTVGDTLDHVVGYTNDNKFVTNLDGAVITRMGPRVFIGGAVDNDGDYPNVSKDWLSDYETTNAPLTRTNGTMVSSQVGILNNDYFGAGVALLTGVQTLNFITASTGASGFTSVMVNNNATYATNGWAGYFEAHRHSDTVGQAIGVEIDTRNSGSLKTIHPYAQDAKMSVSLQLASGAEYPAAGQFDSSAAINIRDNGSKYEKGIVFGATSITGTDGVTGTGKAISFALGHQLTWTNSSGATTGAIWGTATSTANLTELVFADAGMLILGPSGSTVALFRPTASAVNYLDFRGNQTGNAPVIAVNGSDANIDLQIDPKGTGLLRFGTATSMVANGSVATTMTSLGPTGSNTTVQEWLAVKNSAGTIRYIPCY